MLSSWASSNLNSRLFIRKKMSIFDSHVEVEDDMTVDGLEKLLTFEPDWSNKLKLNTWELTWPDPLPQILNYLHTNIVPNFGESIYPTVSCMNTTSSRIIYLQDAYAYCLYCSNSILILFQALKYIQVPFIALKYMEGSPKYFVFRGSQWKYLKTICKVYREAHVYIICSWFLYST